MAFTIDPTVGGASANSFTTLAEFTTYMEGRLNSDDFDDATDDTKNRALGEATRWLSTLSWRGTVVTSTQALAWPRQWAPNPDSPNWEYFDTDEIPGRVKRGTYELAFEFIRAGTSDIATLDANSEVKQKTVDVLTTVYFDSHARPVGLERYPNVMREVRPLLAASGLQVPLVRG